LSYIIAPRPIETFDALSREAIALASTVSDAYLQYFTQCAVGWTELNQGRVDRAHQAAHALMAVGRRMNDPRSIGFGMQLLAWIALISDDYGAGLRFAETGMGNACTPFDWEASNVAYACALVLLKRPEGYQTLRNFMDRAAVGGWLLCCMAQMRYWA
jgi:hypothetical protein